MITLNRKVRFSHPDITYSVTNYTEYLFGSVGLKVNADIRVEVAWSTQAVNMTFLASDDSVQRLDGGSNSFVEDGFKAGDIIVITGTVSNNGTFTISSVNDYYIFITGAFTNETVVSNIFGETPIISMDFYPNLIGNNSDFNLFNLTDRETKAHYYADTITTDAANPSVMLVGTNSKGWVTPTDRATIYRSSFTNHIQTFVISHTFNIAPIYLAGQLTNLQNKKEVPLFKDGNSPKYVFTIDGKYSAFDPDPAHTTDGNVEFPNGQVGWFNEFINGRPSTWTLSYLQYNTLTVPKTQIEYCQAMYVEAHLQAQSICTNSTFKIQVMYLPQNEDEYINTTTNFTKNFIYERAVVTTGGGASNGENTGDDHFIYSATVQAFGSNLANIQFYIIFSAATIARLGLKDGDDLNYLIFITAQHTNTSTDIKSIDQVPVIVDVNTFSCNKDDATLFQIIDEVQFFEYPLCNGFGFSNFSLLPMDTVLVKAQFLVKQGTSTDLIKLKNITLGINAVKQNDVEEFPLETFTINTSGFLPNCDNVQEIEFSQERDFILPSTDCRNEIRLFRMPTLDITGYSAYEVIYPFKVRWEEWRKLEGANRCFSDPTQNWTIYANSSGWSIKFNIKAEVEDELTGHTTSFEHIVWGTIKDPCEIPYAVQFNTYDVTTVNNYEGVVATDADTYVEATITGDFTGLTASQLYGILTLDAYGVGGVAYSQEIGTRLNVDADGAWYGAGSTLVATLIKVSNTTMKLTAFLNYLYLPKDTDQYILSARVGLYTESQSSSGGGCLSELTIYAFTCGELEIIQVLDANTLVVSGIIDTPDFRDIPVQDLVLTFVTATTWTVSGGTINGNLIISGSVGGTIITAPAHPYTDANVGNTLQGEIIGNLYTSTTEINGIGDMQIGCTFFVS